MEKITVITVALVFIQCTQVIAQSEYHDALQKGSMLEGRSMAINVNKEKFEFSSQTSKTNISSFNFNPTKGFSTGNGFALGLSLDLNTGAQKSEEDKNGKRVYTEYLLSSFMPVYTKGGFFSGTYHIKPSYL